MIEPVKHVNELEFNKDHPQNMSPLRLEFVRFTMVTLYKDSF